MKKSDTIVVLLVVIIALGIYVYHTPNYTKKHTNNTEFLHTQKK